MIRMPQYSEKIIPKGKGIRGPKKYTVNHHLGVCWHWTSNKKVGAGAQNHLKFWHNTVYGAHYVVDSEEIIKTALHGDVVWHAGPSDAYTAYIKRKYPKGANLSLIGVELCVNSDGDWEKTYQNAVWLGAKLCREEGFDPYKDFVRHFDCTGKDCPQMWTKFKPGGEAVWKKFLDDVAAEIRGGMVKDMKDIIGRWSQGDIEYLEKKGIVKGDPQGNFNPDQPITREEVAVIVARAVKYVKGEK
jgi:N-acetylmuramoyl-L-alanine amidase CwlA